MITVENKYPRRMCTFQGHTTGVRIYDFHKRIVWISDLCKCGMIVPSIPSARVRWTYVRVLKTYHGGTDVGLYHTFITLPQGDGRLSARTRCMHIAWGLALTVENTYPKVLSPTWQHRTLCDFNSPKLSPRWVGTTVLHSTQKRLGC